MIRNIFVCLFLSVSVSALAVTDTLVFKDGQLLVGEIKEMNKGVIIFETSFSDSDFKIEWDKVKELKTRRTFNIYTTKNGRFFGKIFMEYRNDSIVGVQIDDDDRDIIIVPILEIVYIKSIRNTFWNRLKANVDLGWNWTKAQNLHNVSLNSGIKYYGDLINMSAGSNLVRSFQDSVDNISRTDGNLSLNVFMPKDFFYLARLDFLSNTEQELSLRTTTTTGFGYNYLYTYRMMGGVAIGASWNNEKFSNDDQRYNSLEAYIAANYLLYNFGDIDFGIDISVYPSITEWGRIRSDFSTSIKYDLPWDFYIGMTYTMNYDSNPANDAANLDFVLQTSFGWKWDP